MAIVKRGIWKGREVELIGKHPNHPGLNLCRDKEGNRAYIGVSYMIYEGE